MGDTEDFARREMEGFFRRREERGKFYCAGCLVEQLRQRGAQGVLPVTWTAIEGAFTRPKPLRFKPGAPCAACHRAVPVWGLRPAGQ